MSFLDRVYERARKLKARIVLAEGEDARVQEAARRIEREGLAAVRLLERRTTHERATHDGSAIAVATT